MSAVLAAIGSRPKTMLAVLVVAVFALYAPSLANGYALDDTLLASPVLPDGSANGMTAHLRPLADYFRHGYWYGNGGEVSPLYRPLPILSYAINNALGLGPPGHHLFNVVLHCVAVVLAYALAVRLGAAPATAWVAAALFGGSAIHSEVVAGVVGRAELLMFCFGAAATLLFAAVVAARGRRRCSGCLLSSLLFALALSSKESGAGWIAFAFVCAVVAELARRPAGSLAAAVRAPVLPLLAAAVPAIVAFAVLRHLAIGDAVMQPKPQYLANPLAHVDAATRVRTGLMLWGYGLGKCVWPFPLVSDYGPATFPLVSSVADPRLLAALAALLSLLGLAVVGTRRRPMLLAAAACFVIFSLPVSNVLFPIGTILGERLYFTSSLGVAVAVAWLTTRWSGAGGASVALAVSLWLVANAVAIVARNGSWANDVALMLADADANPRSLRLLDQRARYLRDRGDGGAAEANWRAAIELDAAAIEALTNYGGYLASCGRYAEAEHVFRRALQVPDERRPLRHVTHLNLFVLYEQMHRNQEAEAELRAAWLEPEAYEVPAEGLLRPTAARLPVDEVRRIASTGESRSPGRPEWMLLRGYLAHRTRAFGEAIDWFERVLRVRAGDASVRLALAAVSLDAGRREAGRALLEELRADGRVPASIREQASSLLSR